MKPKEKAKELVDRFKNLRVPIRKKSPLTTYVGSDMAIQCALIAVDEIIKECGNWTGGTNIDWDKKRFEYWQEVKQEIEAI